MIYKSIRVKNIGPFLGDFKIDIPKGPTVIIGTYEGSESSSNRSGKSYFAVDCPLYALFGVHRGKLSDIIHRNTDEECFVEIDVVSSDGKEWLIKRGRTEENKPIRQINNVSASENEMLECVRDHILGLDHNEYIMTNAFMQGDMHGFMTKGNKDRSMMVAPWFQTDRWIPRQEHAKNLLNKAKAKLAEKENRIAILEGKLLEEKNHLRHKAELKEEIKKEKNTLKNLEDDYIEAVSARKLNKELKVQIKEFKKRELELEKIVKNEVQEIEENYILYAENLTNAKRILHAAEHREEELKRTEEKEASRDELNEKLQTLKVEYETLQNEVDVDKTRLEDLKETIERLELNREGICPIINESCDRIKLTGDKAKEYKVKRLKLVRKIARNRNRLEQIEWEEDMIQNDISILNDEISELYRLRKKISVKEAKRIAENIKSELKEIEDKKQKAKISRLPNQIELTTVRRNITKLEKKIIDVDDIVHSEEYTECKLNIQYMQEDLVRVEHTLSKINEKKKEIKKLTYDRKELKTKVKRTAWAQHAFGPGGIPSREIENAFGTAETAMNSVLDKLKTNLVLNFQPTREMAVWEPNCLACGEPFQRGEKSHRCKACDTPRQRKRKEEMRLDVYDHDNLTSFDVDSGGGKIILSIACRLGLASLPGAIRHVKCEHAIIDEPDGALDDPNRERLHHVIRNFSELGIQQTLLITHANIKHEFNSVIHVHRFDDEDRSIVYLD